MLQITANEWNAVVRKKKQQTPEFKKLHQEMMAHLINTSTKASLKAAWDAWVAKFVAKGKDHTASDRYVKTGPLDKIATYLAAAPPVAPRAPRQSPAAAARPGVRPGAGGGGAAGRHAIPKSHADVIAARNARDKAEGIRTTGNAYAKSGGVFKQKIFNHEETYSCTCACATTFMSKIMHAPIDEGDFKSTYNRINGGKKTLAKAVHAGSRSSRRCRSTRSMPSTTTPRTGTR